MDDGLIGQLGGGPFEIDGRNWWVVTAKAAGEFILGYLAEDLLRAEATPPLAPGFWVRVTADGSCVNVRAVPGLAAPALSCLVDGTTGQITGGPEETDGYRWWPLTAQPGRGPGPYGGFVRGWMAESFLRLEGQSALTFQGMHVGERVGDFTVELIRGTRVVGPFEGAFMVLFSGTKLVTGEYSWVCCASGFVAFEVDEGFSDKVPVRGFALIAADGANYYETVVKAFVPEALLRAQRGSLGPIGRATIRVENFRLIEGAMDAPRWTASVTDVIHKEQPWSGH